jgi:hypothetical protein
MNVSDVYVASQADDPNIESPGENFLYFLLLFYHVFCIIGYVMLNGRVVDEMEGIWIG